MTAEHNRRAENAIAIGKIAEVNDAGGRVRVSISGRVTGELQYPAVIGRNFIASFPERVGTQVVTVSPSGDPANAAVVGRLYSNATPRPSADPDLDIVSFNDGSVVSYHSGSGVMTIKAATKLHIIADVEVEGSINATGQIIDAGGNTNHHSH